MSAVAGNSNSINHNNNNNINSNNKNNNNNIGHKLNENLILNATNGLDTGIEANIPSAVVKSHSALTVNGNLKAHLQQQQQASKIQNTQQQQQQQHSQQQRRSLLPSPAHQSLLQHNHSHHNQHNHLHQHHTTQQQQQQSAALPSASTSATAIPTTTTTSAAHLHQVQTVATIHHEQSQQQHQQQHQQQQQQSTSATSVTTTLPNGNISTYTTQHSRPSLPNPTTNTTSVVNTTSNPHSRRSLYHLQSLKSAANATVAGNSLKAPTHSIPPRYQPPPQPLNGGILKHYNGLSATQSNGIKSTQSYFTDATGAHLNLKYPPDIPQLSTVYIPDSIKAQGNSTRFLQQQRQQQQQQQQAHQQQQQTQVQQQQDMLKFVRKTDQDHPSPSASVTSSQTGIPTTTGRLTAEQNRQLQSLINELRALKEQNQRLLDDNQELRDLCCFLDDDRQKGRKLAREWQRFGRYTASVMRQEVAAYQNKLRQLDDKQQELITDNLELKELCLYLDEERAHVAANALCANCGASVRNALRDDGDGSSSSTNADETITALRNYERQLPDVHLRNATTAAATATALTTLNDQTLQYVRSLERRIQQLEEERVTSTTPTANVVQQAQAQQQQQQQQQAQQQQLDALTDPISGRPEAVVRALQVLEVREQIERDRLGNLTGTTALDQMDDGEKALVREMCNVVWRKLESSPPGPATLETL